LKIDRSIIHYLPVSIILIFFIIISLNIPPETIIVGIDNDNKIRFSHEYMSGGEDDVPFAIASIIFIPITVINIINIIRRKKINTIICFILTILLQIFLINIWLDNGDILLNTLYGTIMFKLWIIIFSLIICYTLISLIILIKKHTVFGVR